jgi:hypothetical protein
VLTINTSTYTLNSFDWDVNKGTGAQINIGTGTWLSYNGSNKVLIDATASKYPFMLGNIEEPTFKISWDGSLEINSGAFTIDREGNLSSGPNGENYNFTVSKEGKMNAIGATLSDLIIADDAIFQGNVISSKDAAF